MNIRQVFGLAGGFFVVYIAITLTNRPHAPSDAERAARRRPAAEVEAQAQKATGRVAAPIADGRMRGFTVVPADGRHFAGDGTAEALRGVVGAGAGWVAFAPAIAQPTGRTGEVPADPTAGLAVDDLRQAVKAARALNLHVLIRPVVVAGDGTHPAQLAPGDAQTWLASYARAIAPYLAMAEEEHADAFCLGRTLARTEGLPGWAAVIADARTAYKGFLTYAAGHDPAAGYQQVGFWKDLDWVGIEAYFSLGAAADAPGLEAGWNDAAAAVERWRSESGIDKPVVFTSVGIPHLAGGAAAPDQPPAGAGEDDAVQAAAADAFFRSCWGRPWLRGAFWHTWSAGGDRPDPYAVAGRAGEDAVRRGFTREVSADGEAGGNQERR